MATTPNPVKRAATFAPGIGPGIIEILDQDVVVVKANIQERNFDGEPRPCVLITLDNGKIYHAWSEALASKISEIPEDEYPLTFKFIRVPTRKPGQSTITFE